METIFSWDFGGYLLVLILLCYFLFFHDGEIWGEIKNFFKQKEVIISGEIYDTEIMTITSESEEGENIYLIMLKSGKHKNLLTTRNKKDYDILKGKVGETVKIRGSKCFCFESIDLIEIMG